MRYDVAIAGGGPAGCATALSLRAHAPSLKVLLVEASRYEAPRIGETLPPLARQLLEHLGVWEAFVAQRHREVHGTVAAWGSRVRVDNDYFFGTAGNGWHLDRTAFDAMLADAAEARGVTVVRGERAAVDARVVVDATGGAAAIARRRGASFVSGDHLVAAVRFYDGGGDDPRTLVEAFADGWWYTAGLPDGKRVVACMTDGDLARGLRLAEEASWSALLSGTTHVAPLVRGKGSELVVRSADSRRLDVAAGDGWVAVGDAASRFDPLSSQGIIKALRSGVFASYAVGDLLVRGDESGVRRYRGFVEQEFASYLTVRTKFYREETRWPEREFWRRRR
ncbi:MAG TPA: tryptophan 7-halogenase [Thermoanaerobaculia bacterium]|jgi:flavin-dependent dehydrogenase